MTDTSAPIAIPIPIATLVASVKAHLAKADHSSEKAEQHFISAGLHLAELKGRYKTEVKASKSHTWPEYVQEKFGLGRSRADELIRIGDGRTTPEKAKADKAASVAKSRARLKVAATVAATSPALPPPNGAIKAPCALECLDITDIAEPTDSDETTRHRAFMHRAAEAQRLAKENGLDEIAASEEVADEIIVAAFLAAKAWGDLMTELTKLQLKQRKGSAQ
jgi:hypothetical protein